MAAPIIWSLHDVSPETFARARSIVGTMADAGVRDLAILIVPSATWTDDQLETLRTWDRSGYVLGAHGWTHRAVPPRDLPRRPERIKNDPNDDRALWKLPVPWTTKHRSPTGPWKSKNDFQD